LCECEDISGDYEGEWMVDGDCDFGDGNVLNIIVGDEK